MLMSDFGNHFIPIYDIPKHWYDNNLDNMGDKIVDHIEMEAERLRAKGCDVILVSYINGQKPCVLLCRKLNKFEYFKLSQGYSNIKAQLHKYVDILKADSTKLIKAY